MKGEVLITDFTTWLLDNDDRIYCYWVYKRMFTPAEQAAKWSDQSCFEDNACSYGRIEEAVELPDGDVLIGFRDPRDAGTVADGYITYYKLSEIHLVYCPGDQERIAEELNA